MLKERPYQLNQKLKRVQASRDNMKASNREKMYQNKALRDRNVEITQSRDMWRSRSLELEKVLANQREDLERQIETAKKAIEDEKMRVEKERERADLLQVELEDIKKKIKTLKA
jgi:hypothetical protein